MSFELSDPFNPPRITVQGSFDSDAVSYRSDSCYSPRSSARSCFSGDESDEPSLLPYRRWKSRPPASPPPASPPPASPPPASPPLESPHPRSQHMATLLRLLLSRSAFWWSCLSKPPPNVPFSKRMPFEREPMTRIFAELPRSTLAVAMRVNSTFYNLGVELLYERLVFGPCGPWPRFDNEGGGYLGAADWDDTAPYNRRDSVSTVQGLCADHYVVSRASLLKCVRIIDIFPHSTARCLPESVYDAVSSETLPALPNLEVLRVHMTDALVSSLSQRAFHINELLAFVMHKRYKGPLSHLIPQCPILYRLRPRKLVVLGGPAVYITQGVTTIPYDTLAAVDKYVLLYAPDAELLNAHPNSPVPVARARNVMADIANVANATTVVLVFYTPSPHVPWGGDIGTVSTGNDLKDTWAGRFFAELAAGIARLPPWQKVVIVNAGAIDERGLTTSYWNPALGMPAIEHHFRAYLHRARYDPIPRSQHINTLSSVMRWSRTATISFLSMKEYISAFDVEGEFEPAEIRMWLNEDPPTRQQTARSTSVSPRPSPDGNADGNGMHGYRWSQGHEHDVRFEPILDPRRNNSA